MTTLPSFVFTPGAKFRLRAIRLSDQAEKNFLYENGNNVLTEEDGSPVFFRQGSTQVPARPVLPYGKTIFPTKTPRVYTLKISLGLSCNYSCEYCSQRFVPHAEETSAKDIEAFLAQLETHLVGAPAKIEFWGGEPLVYWKTLRPLGEALRVRYPHSVFSLITNGSLLDAEKNAWLVQLGFHVAISHDGPGQATRGPDPFDDLEKHHHILDLYRQLRPSNRISFNAMLHRHNLSRQAIQTFFVALTGDLSVPLGEGGVIAPYDAGGLSESLTPEETITLRRNTLNEIRDGSAENFSIIHQRMRDWVQAFETSRSASTLSATCGMDQPDRLAVDLRGNVLTCQNVSAEAVAPNGQSHRLGSLTALTEVEMKTVQHWSHRAGCQACPVLQACAGTCMFLEGPLRYQACENSYNDHIAFFAAAIEMMTGFLPIYIEPLTTPLPEARKVLWDPIKPLQRVIPIVRQA